MKLRPTPLSLALLAGLASLAACESRPTRTGSPIRDPNNPPQLRPGSPAVAADGEVFQPNPRANPQPSRPVANATPPKPAPAPRPATPKPATPAGREPAIDLGDDPAAKPTNPTPTANATPPAAPAKPAPAREPAIDLGGGDAPAQPAAPRPAPRPAKPQENPTPAPAPPPIAQPEDTTPAAKVDPSSIAATTGRAMELVQALARSEQPDVRANAIEAAGLIPKKLEAVIVAGLVDRNEGVQSVAAMTIGKQRLATLAPRARSLLGSPSSYVQAAAVMALARNGEPVDDAQMSRLAELLFTNPSPRIRAHVAFVLGEIGNPSALPMIKDAASLKMPLAAQGELNSMQLQMAEAMVKLGDLDRIEAIRAALQPARPEDLEATAVAVQILGELGDKRPIDQLVYLSAYRDPTTKAPFPAEVRMQVASSLAKLGLDKGGFIADEFLKSPDPALRSQAAGVYGDTGRAEHLEKLATLMEDPVEQVRITAAAAVLKVARKQGALPK